MADERSPAQRAYGDIAPALADLSDRVLFGEVWERPVLSKRDRSLITVASLIALYRTNDLPGHVRRALANGITRDELIEIVTHLAFYAGWPVANSAIPSCARPSRRRRPQTYDKTDDYEHGRICLSSRGSAESGSAQPERRYGPSGHDARSKLLARSKRRVDEDPHPWRADRTCRRPSPA